MLTLFSSPKAFTGPIARIQRNAIASWARLGPQVEIVLLGDEPGTAELAAELGLQHQPSVACSTSGAPLLDDVVARMRRTARHRVLGWVNADVILMDDLLDAVASLAQVDGRFLMVAGRIDLRVDDALDLDNGWQADLRRQLGRAGARPGPHGSDLFVFSDDAFVAVPPLAIGRGYWDNWLMHAARRRGAMLIDATPSVTAVHQTHDYAHLVPEPGGAQDDRAVLASPEGRRNLNLAGGPARLCTVADSDYVLVGGRLLSSLRPPWLLRRLRAGAVRHVRARLPRSADRYARWRYRRQAARRLNPAET
jgi:hypothetical protein